MIVSSLPHVSHKTALFRALFSVGTGVQESNRYPSTVNRVFCLMQWYDRELTAFGMSHRTAPPEPLFSVGNRRSTVIRQPSTVFKRQPGLQPAIDPELY